MFSKLSYALAAAGLALSLDVPDGAVYVDPFSFAVLGVNGTFRNDTTPFNPTNSSTPVFQVFDKSFLDVLGDSPSFRLIAENSSFAFAHEAPVYLSNLNMLYFAANGGGTLSYSGANSSNIYSYINMTEVDSTNSTVPYTPITSIGGETAIQMMNGATPHNGSILLMSQGRNDVPPTMALLNPSEPFNYTVLLDNFFGRQFNSLNDVKVHPSSGAFFFCDVAYGYYQDFRPLPIIPNQVYRYDPNTGGVRVVADQLNKPNGLAFSEDGTEVYVTDTGAAGVDIGTNWTYPATIYKYDVDPTTQMFTNRRVFAYSDDGIPDGIQLDNAGRVYSGCGDGVQVWGTDGTLIGKFYLGSQSSNMLFIGKGKLVILAETKIYLASIDSSVEGQDLESL